MKVKVPGYGLDGPVVEICDDVEIRHEEGSPTADGDEWEPSRWEIWDSDEIIWRLDYSGVAQLDADNPKEEAHRQIKHFAALYSLGKQNEGELGE